MPAKALWLLHIPEIIAMLETFDAGGGPCRHRAPVRIAAPSSDRTSAVGMQAGRTFLVDRRLLIEHLRRLAAGEEFQEERQRKERLDDAVDQLRRHQAAARVRIPVEPDVSRRKLDELSVGIALEAGCLHIEFAGAEDLLAKLYELPQKVPPSMISNCSRMVAGTGRGSP